MFKVKYISALLILSTLCLQGQNIRFSHLSLEDGLSQSSIYSITQDNQGFMWFGTENGLNRYDGYNFKVYFSNINDSSSLSNSFINYIYNDAPGVFWIATEQGLNRFDQQKEIFTRYLHNPDDPSTISNSRIFSVVRDHDGDLWIGTADGLNRFDQENNRFVRYLNDPDDANSISNNFIMSVYVDAAGILWVGTNGGGLNRFNKQSGHFTSFKNDPRDAKSISDDNVLSLYEDKSATLWIGTENGGLNRFDPATESFISYRHNPRNKTSISDDHINVIFEDKTGMLWIGTHTSGISIFDREKEVFKHDFTNADDAFKIASNRIMSIFEDYTGTIWVGAYAGSINIYNREAQKFAHFKNEPNNPNSLSYNDVRPIYEDRNEILWIGTDGGGLNRFDRKNNSFKKYKNDPNDSFSISDNKVFAICEDQDGLLWVGTQGGGLNKFNRKTGKFYYYKHDPDNPNSLVDDRIRAIEIDQSGTLWIGTNGGGVSRFDPRSEQFTNYRHEPDNPNSLLNDRIYRIFIDSSDNVWMASYGGGLAKLGADRRQFTHYINSPGNPNTLISNFVLAMYEDNAGILWIGSAGGLTKFDHKNNSYVHYDKTNGFPDNVVYDIVGDDNSDLWVTTNGGLSRFNPNTLDIKNYEIIDGLQSNEFNTGTGCKAKNGEIFFGGINGFNAFRPEEMRDNPYMPKIVVTNFRLFNNPVPIGEMEDGRILLENSINHTGEIELSYKDKVFSFEFVALHYTSPEKNKYAYMIEGFEDEWNYVGNRRFVSYTGLPSGEYVFRVKGSNNDGLWNEDGAAIKITITPPFYATAWFIALMNILLVTIVYAGYRARIRRITLQREMLKREVKRKTKELNARNKNLTQAKKETDNILKHVKDGLFLLDGAFNIESQYSSSLETILENTDLAKKSFISFLNNKTSKETIENVTNYLNLMIDDTVDEEALESLNPLSEVELTFENTHSKNISKKFLTFDFKRIKEKDKTQFIIATVNDITDKIHLENDLEETRQENKRKIDLLLCLLNVDPLMLGDFLKSTREETKEIEAALTTLYEQDDPSEQLNLIYRLVHNIKGNARLLELEYFADRAHKAENNIQEMKGYSKLSRKHIKELLEQIEVLKVIQNEIKEFIEQVGKIRDHFPAKNSNDHLTMVKTLSKLVDNLNTTYNKKSKLITAKFKGEAIPDSHRLLVRDILVQLIKNSVYHGIEDEQERRQKGKQPFGKIEIENYKKDGNFVLVFKDDGRGIDLAKLREKAIEMGKWSEDEISSWDNKKLAEIIYKPGVTTLPHSNIDAGRGVGMDIIKNKLKQHNGLIDIDFNEDKYCSFSITLPLN